MPTEVQTPMLSESQVNHAWDEMLSAEIRALYFADMARWYTKQQQIVTWGILFLSSGAFVVFFVSNLPDHLLFLRPVLPLLAAALSLFSLVRQNQKLAFDATELHKKWNQLASDYRVLWDNVYIDDAQTVLAGLIQRGHDLSAPATTMPRNEKALSKWQDYVMSRYYQEQPGAH
jgi:hypothetical protein